MILFLPGLTPRCKYIFTHRCCFQPVRRFRQQMGRAQARTIMERKWVRPAVPDRREPGAGPSGQTYFRSSVRSLLDRVRAWPVALWMHQQALWCRDKTLVYVLLKA